MLRTVRRAGEFGIDTTDQPVLDLGASQQRKQAVIDRLFQGLGALLADRDVTVYDGTGRLGRDRTIEVTGGNGSTVIAANHVVLATGSTPRTLAGFDVDGRLVVTSDEFLSTRERPDRVAVIGGGAVGCEFASMLVDFGSSVTLLEVLDGILSGCDPDVSSVVRRSFAVSYTH